MFFAAFSADRHAVRSEAAHVRRRGLGRADVLVLWWKRNKTLRSPFSTDATCEPAHFLPQRKPVRETDASLFKEKKPLIAPSFAFQNVQHFVRKHAATITTRRRRDWKCVRRLSNHVSLKKKWLAFKFCLIRWLQNLRMCKVPCEDLTIMKVFNKSL